MYPEMHQIGNSDTFILRRVCFLFLLPEIYLEYKSNRHICWKNPNPFHYAPTQIKPSILQSEMFINLIASQHVYNVMIITIISYL